jgi:hypothetical protein
MKKNLKKVENAMDRIDAPDNDEQDRLHEADRAIAKIQKLPPSDQESFAKKELIRFQNWLNNRHA